MSTIKSPQRPERIWADGEPIACPEGWKLVPVDPSDLMTYKGQQVRYPTSNSITVIYRAMIAAAPTPPAVVQAVPHPYTDDMLIAAMEASVLGRPSVDDDAYVRSILDAANAAADRKAEPTIMGVDLAENGIQIARDATLEEAAQALDRICNHHELLKSTGPFHSAYRGAATVCRDLKLKPTQEDADREMS